MGESLEGAALKRRVIVADDDHVVATTLSIILSQAGFAACAAFSGQEVIDLLDSFQPDILITDVFMPCMTGIEVAIEVRRRLPECQILLFSGHGSTVDLLEQARMEGHEFEIVPKPIHPSELLAKLRVSKSTER